MKIENLFTFDPIQPVIKISDIKDEVEMIKNFVISKNLEDHLIYFLKYLNGEEIDNNISVNIIGNYGTGKSHFLAFLSLILSKPELREYIQNEKIREAFSNLEREFLVVKYELGQNIPLAEIFYYRVRKQLKENYDIDIREIDLKTEKKDNKELLEEIMINVKEKYPSKGLIVLFDEYSDFIKGKDNNNQIADLNFTRQLAESSSNQDFILMLSMQEHIFSNPEYKANAEVINKIEQRFLKINITSENIEDIISKRMVKKDGNQIQKIKKLFGDYQGKFQNLSIEEDRYAQLFPVHPYLIEVFSKITFFENRSILQFVSDEISKILDKDFPQFITYDLIYESMIESEHTVKNKEEVKPVVNIVKSLKDIINRLDDRYKKNAIRLVESLAIKNLITPPDEKGDKKGGDTAEKFVENLFIIPKSQLIDPVDDVEMILNMLIKESIGQFINKDNESDVYFITLKDIVDYEQIINNKASTIRLDSSYEIFVEEFLLEELGFEYDKNISYFEASKKYVLEDSVKWKERNSFRDGIFIINIGNKLKFDKNQDFIVVLNIKAINGDCNGDIVIKPKYGDDFSAAVKRLVAVEYLIKSHTYLDIMKGKRRTIIDQEIKPSFKKSFLKSKIVFEDKDYNLEELGISSDIISDIFSQIKEKLLGEKLTEKYHEYPRFKSKLSNKNIVGTFETILKDIPNEGAVKDLINQDSNILLPLGLYKNNMLDVNESKYAQIILEKVEDTGKNLDINEILEEFSVKPYGFQKEIVYLIIAILLRNGDVMLSSSRGKTFSSTDFGTLFKSGLKAFDDIKYIKKEEGPGFQTQLLFDTLDLDKSLLQLKKNHQKAFSEYSAKIEHVINDIKDINSNFKDISYYKIALPFDEIDDKITFINNVDFSKLKISSLAGFKNLDYSSQNLENIKKSYILVYKLKSLFNDIKNYINPGISYMENVLNWIDNDFFKSTDKQSLRNIYNDSIDIVHDFRKLLKEDERNPLKGKIEQFKEKYKTIYYNAHNECVGEGVDWNQLLDIESSNKYYKLNKLKDINSVNTSLFRNIQLMIKNIKDLHCNNFRIEDLDNNYHCVCMFPESGKFQNINKQIEELDEKI